MAWRYSRQAPDPANTVASAVPGYWYVCPSVAAVDGHIRELAWQVEHAENRTARRRAALREHIDPLLDRRLYVEMCAPAGAA
jgi:hypothetical protein